jgi:hypothetical protein
MTVTRSAGARNRRSASTGAFAKHAPKYKIELKLVEKETKPLNVVCYAFYHCNHGLTLEIRSTDHLLRHTDSSLPAAPILQMHAEKSVGNWGAMSTLAKVSRDIAQERPTQMQSAFTLAGRDFSFQEVLSIAFPAGLDIMLKRLVMLLSLMHNLQYRLSSMS